MIKNKLKWDSFKTKKGKGVRIYRPSDFRDGQYVPRKYYELRICRNKKRVKFRLKGNKRAAAQLADEIFGFLSDSQHTLEEAIERFYPERAKNKKQEIGKIDPTIGDVIRRFEEYSTELQKSTIKAYAGALRQLGNFILKSGNARKLTSKDSNKVDALPLSRITSDLLLKFRSVTLKEAGTNCKRIESAKISANACIRNASALFSKRILRHYEDFNLPTPLPFHEITALRERIPRYQSSFSIQKLLIKAAEDLRENEPSTYISIVLAAYAGLRRGEISELTWDQIDFDRNLIMIKTTNTYVPKAANSEHPIYLPDCLVEDLKYYESNNKGGSYVVEGSSNIKSLRCRALMHKVTKWLKQNGVNDSKPLHALRKEAGSFIFNKTGSIDKASKFLRNDRKTAEKHYISYDEKLIASYVL